MDNGGRCARGDSSRGDVVTWGWAAFLIFSGACLGSVIFYWIILWAFLKTWRLK